MFKEFMRSPKYRRRLSLIIAGSLLLPLAFYFQASSKPPRGPGGAAGMMFGKPVPWDVFEAERAQLRRLFQQQFGDMADLMLPMLTQATWDRLLLLEEAKRRRMTIGDQELARTIEQDPTFQKNGRFDLPTYRMLLRAQGFTPQRYEERVRRMLLGQKLMQTITNDVTVAEEEVEATYRAEHEQRRALLVIVRPSEFTKEADKALTEADLHRAYEDHPDWVRIPEQLTVEYAGLSQDEAAAAPTEEQIAAFYEEHAEEFLKDDGARQPLDEVRAQIQQRLAADGARRRLNTLLSDLEEDAEAKRPLKEIAAARGLTARTAGPFAVESAWAPTGLDPGFLEALRELPEGESRVIELAGGVYVARVASRLPSRVPPFEEVASQVRERLTAERAQALARERASALHARLTERIKEGWRAEEAMVSESWLPSQSVTLSRNGAIDSKLGVVPEINHAVFTTPVGQLSQVIETQAGFAFVRPEAVIPPDMTAFAAQKETFQQELLARKRTEQFEMWLQDLRARAKLQSFVDSPAS